MVFIGHWAYSRQTQGDISIWEKGDRSKTRDNISIWRWQLYHELAFLITFPESSKLISILKNFTMCTIEPTRLAIMDNILKNWICLCCCWKEKTSRLTRSGWLWKCGTWIKFFNYWPNAIFFVKQNGYFISSEIDVVRASCYLHSFLIGEMGNEDNPELYCWPSCFYLSLGNCCWRMQIRYTVQRWSYLRTGYLCLPKRR